MTIRRHMEKRAKKPPRRFAFISPSLQLWFLPIIGCKDAFNKAANLLHFEYLSDAHRLDACRLSRRRQGSGSPRRRGAGPMEGEVPGAREGTRRPRHRR